MTYKPDLWFIGILQMQDNLNKLHLFVIKDKDVAEHILNNTRHEYNSCVIDYKNKLKSNMAIDLEDLQESMQDHYELYWKRNGKYPLSVTKKFNFDNIFLKPKNKFGLTKKPKPRKKFKVNCDLCSRQGHKQDQCWENPKNASKRPKGWKSILKDSNNNNKDKVANQVKDQSKAKCQLCRKTNHGIDKCDYNPFNPNNKLKDLEICNPCTDVDVTKELNNDLAEVGFTALSVPISIKEPTPKTDAPTTFQALNNINLKTVELGLHFPDMNKDEIWKCVWIADSGASTHMYTQDCAFTNCQVNKSEVEVGEGSTSTAPKIG